MKNTLRLIVFITTLLALTSCTGFSTKAEDDQPYLNGQPVKAIYYDDIEEPVGYGRYGAYLFFLPDNQFVILRNREEVNYFLSNLSTLQFGYPSARHPIRYTINGNSISALVISDYTNDDKFKPHIHYREYEGERDGNTFHIKRSSWSEFLDGSVVYNEPVTWDFRKIRDYQ